ncbi:hypothetical protein BpHYR1_010644 [Brachionus plicatilis]|uniref:Uncharacterized protein n=1 Tax=Brachionus plicatilis TaxID=10195 RepID=A0A3M7PBU3_BRAPC|nr:hypothetical protein BpHYR1_010644 [Brachionus plicatilis]
MKYVLRLKDSTSNFNSQLRIQGLNLILKEKTNKEIKNESHQSQKILILLDDNKGLACYVTSGKGKIVEIDESHYAKVKHSKSTFQSYPRMETITIKESDFLANGTDSDHEGNCESDFEEVRRLQA